MKYFQDFLVKLFSAAIFLICFIRFSKSKLVAILVFVVDVVEDGELLPELVLPELFKRLYVGDIVDGGDLTIDVCRPSGVGELIRCRFLDVGKYFCVVFNNDDWGFNTGGDDGFVDFRDERDDELVVFNDPVFVPFIDCFNKELNDVEVNVLGDGGERFVLLVLDDEVNAVNSASIELADGLVTSDVVFFSLNPVANEAHPLVFFVVIPLVNEEFELDIDGLLIIVLSDVVESDDFWFKWKKTSSYICNWSWETFFFL